MSDHFNDETQQWIHFLILKTKLNSKIIDPRALILISTKTQAFNSKKHFFAQIKKHKFVFSDINIVLK